MYILRVKQMTRVFLSVYTEITKLKKYICQTEEYLINSHDPYFKPK